MSEVDSQNYFHYECRMRYNLVCWFLAISLLGCGEGDSGTNSVSINISGTVDGEAVNIQSGFCSASHIDSSFFVIIGTNRSFPKGVLLIFNSLSDLSQGAYDLPHDKLTARYDATTTATGGSVILASLSKTETDLQNISGQATLTFSGNHSGSLMGQFSCPSL